MSSNAALPRLNKLEKIDDALLNVEPALEDADDEP
jgi:hypothetical protein